MAQLRQTRCLQLRGQLGHDQRIAPDSLLGPFRVYSGACELEPGKAQRAENAEFTSRKSAVRSHFQRSLADAQQILDRLLGTDEGCIMPALCAGTTANWSVDALMTV